MGYNRCMRVEQTEVFRRWIDGLKDPAGRARILARIVRLIGGNPGQHRALSGGISELKVDVGPGYLLKTSIMPPTKHTWPIKNFTSSTAPLIHFSPQIE